MNMIIEHAHVCGEQGNSMCCICDKKKRECEEISTDPDGKSPTFLCKLCPSGLKQ